MATDIIINELTPVEATVIGVKSIMLNNDQIKLLPTTEYDIVEAPGANKVIIPVQAIIVLKPVVSYANTSAVDAYLTFAYAGGNQCMQAVITDGTLSSMGTFFGGPAIEKIKMFDSGYGGISATYGQEAQDSLSSINKKLVLQGWNADGNFTSGDAANTMKITVLYVVVDV